MRSRRAVDHRDTPRFKIPPMYTLLRVRPQDHDRYCWTGYVHDLSAKGMRFELDYLLPPGTPLQIRAMLPGPEHITFSASGHVVRIHDDDGLCGAIRMAMTFEQFSHDADRARLSTYLERPSLKAA